MPDESYDVENDPRYLEDVGRANRQRELALKMEAKQPYITRQLGKSEGSRLAALARRGIVSKEVGNPPLWVRTWPDDEVAAHFDKVIEEAKLRYRFPRPRPDKFHPDAEQGGNRVADVEPKTPEEPAAMPTKPAPKGRRPKFRLLLAREEETHWHEIGVGWDTQNGNIKLKINPLLDLSKIGENDAIIVTRS